MTKTLIDVFSGCGGLSLGLEQAGFSTVFASDIDPVCCHTYKLNRNLPDDRIFVGDIHDLNNKWCEKYKPLLGEIDLVCGGPPCQGFSTANRQRIINDPRNILYKEYLIFLNHVRPKFFIMENVKGMMQKVNEILFDIKTILGEDYNVSYRVLNAKNFGVPQNRERFILIGNRVHIDSNKIFENILSEKYPMYTLDDAISDLPELKPNRIKNRSDIENEEVGFKVLPFKYKKTPFRDFINSKEIFFLHNHKNRYNNDRDIEIFTRLPQGENSLHYSIKDIMPYSSRKNIFKDKYFKLKANTICKTITSHMKYDCNMYIHPTQARGLSPREAARIQTFPDSFVFYGSQNSWYHQIGNAVPVKLAEAIGKEIIKWL